MGHYQGSDVINRYFLVATTYWPSDYHSRVGYLRSAEIPGKEWAHQRRPVIIQIDEIKCHNPLDIIRVQYKGSEVNSGHSRWSNRLIPLYLISTCSL